MTLRRIAQLGEPVLRKAARPLAVDELGTREMQRLVSDMIDTMRDADGAGLAAPQIYESVQIAVIELRENPRYPDVPSIPLRVLINPKVTPLVAFEAGVLAAQDAIQVYEGCLSVAGLRGMVRRPRKVRVNALDMEGNPQEFSCEGFPAAVVQHELDHLHGILYVDRADPRSLAFLREYERYVPPNGRVVDGGAQNSG